MSKLDERPGSWPSCRPWSRYSSASADPHIVRSCRDDARAILPICGWPSLACCREPGKDRGMSRVCPVIEIVTEIADLRCGATESTTVQAG
jgi:hypothetical protein